MSDRNQVAQKMLSAALGKPVSSVIVEEGADRDLLLGLGALRRRPLRLSNRALSFLKRTFDVELRFHINCPWRVEQGNEVLAHWIEPVQEAGALVRRLKVLEGRELVRVAYRGPAHDLLIELEGDVRIACFGAAPNPPKYDWVFESDEGVLFGDRNLRWVRAETAETGASDTDSPSGPPEPVRVPDHWPKVARDEAPSEPPQVAAPVIPLAKNKSD